MISSYISCSWNRILAKHTYLGQTKNDDFIKSLTPHVVVAVIDVVFLWLPMLLYFISYIITYFDALVCVGDGFGRDTESCFRTN